MLAQLGLTKFLDKFEEQDVDLPVFLSLTDNDLKELGIKYVTLHITLSSFSNLFYVEKNYIVHHSFQIKNLKNFGGWGWGVPLWTVQACFFFLIRD